MENSKEYCPNCGHNREHDENKDQCFKCGCFTPAQNYDPFPKPENLDEIDSTDPIKK